MDGDMRLLKPSPSSDPPGHLLPREKGGGGKPPICDCASTRRVQSGLISIIADLVFYRVTSTRDQHVALERADHRAVLIIAAGDDGDDPLP